MSTFEIQQRGFIMFCQISGRWLSSKAIFHTAVKRCDIENEYLIDDFICNGYYCLCIVMGGDQ
jgi:hypothetical protein